MDTKCVYLYQYKTVSTARRTAENRCYVKTITNDVSFFTYYVSFFT